MALREKRRLCKFISEWTTRYEFSSWLVSVKDDDHKAYCLLCRKVFPVSHGGLHDVKAHGKGKKHICLQQQQEQEKRATYTSQGFGVYLHRSQPYRRVFNVSTESVEVVERSAVEKTPGELDREQSRDSCDSVESQSPRGSPPPGDSMQPTAMASAGKMEAPQQYCLRWKYHHTNLQVMFSQLLERESFCDVTLACEGKTLRAHKMMLSACSTYFDAIFSQHEENNPIVILKDVKFADIKTLVEFMYKGEINVENSHLSSLLRTAEELRIKGLAEVSWRSGSDGGGWRSVEGGGESEGEEVATPAKRMKTQPVSQPDRFNPRVSNVLGNVTTKEEFNADDGSGCEEKDMDPSAWGGEQQQHSQELYADEPSNASNTSNISHSPANTPAAYPMPSIIDEERSFAEIHHQDLSKWLDVMKMNDYLDNGGRRPQFWEEPFSKRLMESIKNKEVEMKVAAELLGVSYGTLYGRYRDSYGCLKHPYRVRDFWLEQGPAEVLAKLQRKELTLFRAAEMLNVTVTTLANYLSTLRQGSGVADGTADRGGGGGSTGDPAEEDAIRPDISIVKQERPDPPTSLNGNQ